MAKYGSSKVGFVLVDGYNMLASKIDSLVGPKVSSILEQTDGLGDDWEEHTAVGVRRAELSQSGWWDGADGDINEAFAGQEDVSRIVCIGLHGNSLGLKCTCARGAFGGDFERLAVRDELVKANVAYKITGAVDEDVLVALHNYTRSADFTEAHLPDGGQTTDGMLAYLQVGAVTLGGHSGLSVVVEHATSAAGTYADLVTFDAVTVGRKAQFKSVAGTVRRFVRVQGDFTGNGANPSADIFVGVKRL